LKAVWTALSGIWSQINELREMSWATVQPRKLRLQYDPNPTSTITEEDAISVETFFAIADEDVELEPLFQSLFCLELEQITDHKLSMRYVAGLGSPEEDDSMVQHRRHFL